MENRVLIYGTNIEEVWVLHETSSIKVTLVYQSFPWTFIKNVNFLTKQWWVDAPILSSIGCG